MVVVVVVVWAVILVVVVVVVVWAVVVVIVQIYDTPRRGRSVESDDILGVHSSQWTVQD